MVPVPCANISGGNTDSAPALRAGIITPRPTRPSMTSNAMRQKPVSTVTSYNSRLESPKMNSPVAIMT